MAETGSLLVDGCSLSYRLTGPSDAPVLVLTHGATLDQDSWLPQAQALCDRYRVLLWDLRGHGASQPLVGKFTMARGAADLIALLDHLGIARAALAGLSMGSYVSQRLLYAHPERVAALASFDATSLTSLAMSPLMRGLLGISDKIMMLYPHRMLVEAIAKGAALDPDVQAYIRRVAGQLDKRAIIDIWSAVQTGLMQDPDYREPVPLMIAVGAKDTIGLTYKGAVQWASERPSARFEVIPDAGHCANQDNPDYVTRILTEFLAEHWPADPVSHQTGVP